VKKIEYGVAVYDRIGGTVYEVMHMGLSYEGIEVQSVPHFLEKAGELGWELCGTMPGSVKGNSTPDPHDEAKIRKVEDYNESTLMVFKRVQ